MKLLLVTAAAALALATGCARSPQQSAVTPPPPAVTKEPFITRDQAVAIAKAAVAAKTGQADRHTYDARPSSQGWSVTAWRIIGYDAAGKPQFVPGGHCVVMIDEQGRVTDFVRGR